ncbi:nucleoside monophosphate kinase, partial [Patescibacteria group bacterium]|nr:nucleoside monophosphate kinase [Patescibacteria group bacterium]
KLIPHELIAQGLEEQWTDQMVAGVVVLDGMPRSMDQLVIIEKTMQKLKTKIGHALLINISKEESLRRLASRLVCRKCGENFNTVSKKPVKEDVCDKCGGELYRRSDETPSAVKERLSVYHQETGPVIEEYRKRGILIEVDGERSIEAIHEDIVSKLKQVGVIK